jgi:hypothetical protein
MTFSPPPEDAPHRWAIIKLREKIAASGLSVSAYAQQIGFPRAPNTLYRWLRGTNPIPRVVRISLLDEWRILDAPTTKESDDGPDQG